MSVIEFKLRPKAPDRTVLDGTYLDCRKWQCGSCEANVFHLWLDGVVACAECGTETAGMTATYVEKPSGQ